MPLRAEILQNLIKKIKQNMLPNFFAKNILKDFEKDFEGFLAEGDLNNNRFSGLI